MENPNITEFMRRYKELIDDLKVDIVSYPVYIPDEKGGFRLVIQSSPVDTSKKEEGIPSPFIPEK